MNEYRILPMEPGTHRGNWIVAAPVWVGARVEVRAKAAMTLAEAIKVAEIRAYIGANLDDFRQAPAGRFPQAMTAAEARDFGKKAIAAARAGKRAGIEVAHLIGDLRD